MIAMLLALYGFAAVATASDACGIWNGVEYYFFSRGSILPSFALTSDCNALAKHGKRVLGSPTQ